MEVTKVNYKKEMEPPDGGWGWMVVIGTAGTNVFNQSLLSLFGLLYGDQLERLGQGTQGAALVFSTMLLVLNFGGPLSGYIVNLTSPRTVALTGALLTASGCILSGLSTSLWHIILTYGVLLGLGLGFIQNASFVSLNSYFKARKGRAVGFSAVGTGVGQMLMPHVVRFLLKRYTFAGVTLIMGGLCLQGVIGALPLRPVARHTKPRPGKAESEHLLEFSPELNGIRERHLNLSEIEYCRNRVKRKFAGLESRTKFIPKSLKSKITKLLDMELLSDVLFLNIIVGSALIGTSIQNFSLIFPFFLQEAISLTKDQTATCMSCVAGADILGRLTLPTVAERYNISARKCPVVSSISIIIVRQFIAYQSAYTLLLTASFIYGFCRSMVVVNQNIMVSDHCRPDQVPAAVGLSMLMKGLLVMPVSQMLGWIRDYTQSYTVCITAQNMFLVLLLIMWLPDMLYKRICKDGQNYIRYTQLSIA